MRIEGSYSLKAPRESVWEAFLTPEVLAGCIPGCQRLELEGEDTYTGEVRVGIGAISGTYTGKVRIADKRYPESFRLLGEGRGTGGSAKGEGSVRLVEGNGVTELKFAGDAQISGVVARVGQRLMDSAAKMLMNQFFECIKAKIEEA